MYKSVSYPCTVIDVLADDCDGVVSNAVVKGLFVGVMIDWLDGVLMNTFADMLGSIILVVEEMTTSGFAVSVSPSVVDWPVMTSVEETVICVVSGTVVDVVMTDVGATVLSVALGFITEAS